MKQIISQFLTAYVTLCLSLFSVLQSSCPEASGCIGHYKIDHWRQLEPVVIPVMNLWNLLQIINAKNSQEP